MARADTITLLSIDRYATIMGINPMRFSGAQPVNLADGSQLFQIANEVQKTWPQFAYQTEDQVSREELAREIAIAEREIAEFLGFWPAPRWISDEIHTYPRPHRPETFGFGINVRGLFKEIKVRWDRFLLAGQRAATEIESSVTVAYSDEDGDGFNETATVTVLAVSTDITNVCDIKVYYEGFGGDQSYEIRPPRTATLVGTTFTATFWVWQMIEPSVQEEFPSNAAGTGGGVGIDVTDLTNLIDNVDVYREFTDFSQPSAQFFTEDFPHGVLPFSGICSSCSGTGCTACELSTQNGCIHFRDVNNGLVVPVPATFDEDNEQWNPAQWACNREPSSVKVWYYAGEVSEQFKRSTTCRPMTTRMERAVANLATARLKRPYPANNNVLSFVRDLQRDRTVTPPDGESFLLSEDDLDNPFGTLGGEIKTYRSLRTLKKDKTPRVGVLA